LLTPGVTSISESSSVRAAAATASSPILYVAKNCSSAACSYPNGLVETFGGAKSIAITQNVESPGAIAVDKSGNVYVGSSTSITSGYVSVFAPNSTKR
jgi:Beta-propeller repeat